MAAVPLGTFSGFARPSEKHPVIASVCQPIGTAATHSVQTLDKTLLSRPARSVRGQRSPLEFRQIVPEPRDQPVSIVGTGSSTDDWTTAWSSMPRPSRVNA